MCITYLVMHVGMKSFPQKSWPKSYGQSSGKKLTQNKEGFLLRSRLADGTLIKFPRLLPWNRKSSPLCRTLRLTRKSILIKKKKFKKKEAKWYSFDVYFHLSTKYDCIEVMSIIRQWPTWLECVQLHNLQPKISHAIISLENWKPQLMLLIQHREKENFLQF